MPKHILHKNNFITRFTTPWIARYPPCTNYKKINKSIRLAVYISLAITFSSHQTTFRILFALADSLVERAGLVALTWPAHVWIVHGTKRITIKVRLALLTVFTLRVMLAVVANTTGNKSCKKQTYKFLTNYNFLLITNFNKFLTNPNRHLQNASPGQKVIPSNSPPDAL